MIITQENYQNFTLGAKAENFFIYRNMGIRFRIFLL